MFEARFPEGDPDTVVRTLISSVGSPIDELILGRAGPVWGMWVTGPFFSLKLLGGHYSGNYEAIQRSLSGS